VKKKKKAGQSNVNGGAREGRIEKKREPESVDSLNSNPGNIKSLGGWNTVLSGERQMEVAVKRSLSPKRQVLRREKRKILIATQRRNNPLAPKKVLGKSLTQIIRRGTTG